MFKRFLLYTVAPALLAGSAAAADLPVMPPAPAFSWSGFYGGAHIGGGWSDHNLNGNDIVADEDEDLSTTEDQTVFPGLNSNDLSGVVGGVYAGGNIAVGPMVLGLDADIGWTGMRQSASADFTVTGEDGAVTTTQYASADMDVNWLAHVRGRAGYGFDRFMVYAAGGLALANLNTNVSVSFPESAGFTATTSDGSQTVTGWTVGAGFEWAATDSLIVRAEYLYDQFSGIEPATYEISNTTGVLGSNWVGGDTLGVNIVRVGVSYKFDSVF
ncbi:MAG: outer membrane beta-barrel protein [Hyphomicrobiales bacterium]